MDIFHNNNTVPSPDDSRDWTAESIYDSRVSLPNYVDHRYKLQAVRNQGRQGSCAAQTAACMKEWQENKDIGFNNYMSPQYIYNNRSNQNSEGMFGRDVMKILSNKGCCFEKTYPYFTIEKPEMIKEEAHEEASNFKIKSYAQINTIDGLKKALYINGPCYISFPVYNDSVTMWKQMPGDKRQGGHAMTVVGYNEIGFTIRNSWGTFWGNDGYCTYPYSDWGSHWEVWTTIDDDSFKFKNDEVDPKPIEDNSKDNQVKSCCEWLFKK